MTRVQVVGERGQRTALVLYTRDLRIDDHPALTAACLRCDEVLPLFVFDTALMRSRYAAPNRVALLVSAVTDLRASIRRLGAELFVRVGRTVDEVERLVVAGLVDEIHLSADYSRHSRRRLDALKAMAARQRHAVKVFEHPGVAHVPPGALEPSGGASGHFKVFTPYYRRWISVESRAVLGAPALIPGSVHAGSDSRRAVEPSAERNHASIVSGDLPTVESLIGRRAAAVVDELPAVSEPVVRRQLRDWVDSRLVAYGQHDELDPVASSRLSPALHFGTLSATRLAEIIHEASHRDGAADGAAGFLRQLCWRDFHLQLLAANPDLPRQPLRSEPRWNHDPAALTAWKQGRTGWPIVDAGLRQLLAEGWMPNRVRMLAAAVLTKHLRVDWRSGAWHFLDHLVDGDVANNFCGWQWAAGVGIDTRPGRLPNPFLQAARHDPNGDYIRRYVSELADRPLDQLHQPQALAPSLLGDGYPAPLISQHEAREALRR